MHKGKVRDFAYLTLVPFMEIMSSDVLLSRDLLTKFRSGKGRDKYFLWAQTSCSLTDIWLQEKKQEPLEYDEFGNLVVRMENSEPPKIEAHLPAKSADRYGCGSWNEKRIEIPQQGNVFINEEVAFGAPPFSGDKAGEELIAGINDGNHFFDKECWVLRVKDDLYVHPMALAYCISDLVEKSTATFDGMGDIINHVSELELDQEKLNEFHVTKAENYSKEIRYSYRDILRYDYTKKWTEALITISEPVVNIAEIAAPFSKMGIPMWTTADKFRDLNNNLGALFLSPEEYEMFIRSCSLGYGVPFQPNDPEYSNRWLKWQTAHRGQGAMKAFFEVYGYFHRVLIHCSSSPIERVFARKLLQIMPSKEFILKQSDLVLKEAFFKEHGKDITLGKKIRRATNSGGEISKKMTSKKYEPIYQDAKVLIQRYHGEEPEESWTKITNKVGDEIGVSGKTLRKKFIEDFTVRWKKNQENKK